MKEILPGHIQREHPIFYLSLYKVYFHNYVFCQLGLVATIFLFNKVVADHANVLWPNLISKNSDPIFQALVVSQVGISYAVYLIKSVFQSVAKIVLESCLKEVRGDLRRRPFLVVIFIHSRLEVQCLFELLLYSIIQIVPKPAHS